MSIKGSERRIQYLKGWNPPVPVLASKGDLAFSTPGVFDPLSGFGKSADPSTISPRRPADVSRRLRSIAVPRVARDFQVKIASNRDEWKQAFQLVARNYQACGYEAPLSSKVRFTPYHALPDTVTLVAKLGDRVAMTLTLVPDNTQLGLPLESIYGEDVKRLRRERRRLAEVISLAADKDVNMREFRQVFVTLIKLLIHYHMSRGGDTWVITVNPRHRDFYTKAMGFATLGPPRTYSAVEGHPAEAYYLDVELLKGKAPKMHREIFGEPVPGEVLIANKMLPHLVRYLGGQSSEASARMIRETFNFDKYFMNPRRW